MGCLVQGLEDIHSAGYVQRDIKPANFMIDTNGYLKFTDFGISMKYDINAADKQTINGKKHNSGTVGY